MASLIAVIALVGVTRDPRGFVQRHLRCWRLFRPRPLTASDEARLLREVGADLRAGVHPTAAFLSAANSHAVLDVMSAARQALGGAGTTAVTNDLAPQLPVNRDILGPAAAIAIETGAGLAAVLYRLADRADAAAAEHRERTVATAQARISAAVVGGLPLVGVMAMAATGGFRDLEGFSRSLVAVAVALLVGGIATTAWMVRR
ncbi:MAG: hypothetical protein HKN07_10300 [Acidimicrobiia bacterium]|nr:hypothetical protein [Acidimicrobiia bacterium]